MELKVRNTASELEDDSFTLVPAAIEELPKLHHSADDAAYMDWLNTILMNRDRANTEAVSTERAQRALNRF